MGLKEAVIRLLVKETGLERNKVEQLLEVPPDPTLGDFSFPCFKVSKDPVKEAQRLAAALKLSSPLERVEAKGPYLNFFLSRAHVAESVLSRIVKEKSSYGTLASAPRKNIVVEYCGPNTNKPLHLGHLRNMSLGNAICRLLSFSSNRVHPVNIVNDRGIHISQSLLAYQKWAKGKKPDKKGDHFVGDYYVLFAKELEKNPELEQEAQQLLRLWEQKDKVVRALWKKMNEWVLKGFAETYKRFGVSFEKEYFESEYYEHGKAVAYEGLEKGVFFKDEKGSIVAPLKKSGLSDKIVLRADGTSIYITQDMYLAQERFKDFHFDQMIYVVASEQNLHFKQLFSILSMLGRPFARHLFHLSYGLVNLPTGRMKSREGTVVDADNIIDDIVALAEKEVTPRYPDLSASEKKKRAELIGLGALKFFLLKIDPIRDMVFNPEESIRFDGETGPYLQYTHARACSLLKKAQFKSGKCEFALLAGVHEQTIIKLLAEFPDCVMESVDQSAPHILCHHLLGLAQAFNEFYHACPVISEDKKLMQARLVLVDSVRQVLATGLELLGIVALREM